MRLYRLLPSLSLLLCTPAFAGAEQEIATKLKASGYRCTDTPDTQGIFCVGGSPANYIVLPRGVSHYTKTVFYAHGLVGVCGNGASGENYLKNQSATLRALRAVSVMPYRAAAGNAGFPLAVYIQKMDTLIGTRHLLLAGHSAAGPFFATTLNGTGAGILDRVEKVLILDGGYGDLKDRYSRAMERNSRLNIRIVTTTTNNKSQALYNHLSAKYRENRVKLDKFGGDHCSVPEKYFKLLAN